MAIFVEVNTATPKTKGQPGSGTGAGAMEIETIWKGGKITFDTEQILSYGKYFDPNKNNGSGGYINDKISVSLGMSGFIFNGTISQFETAVGL